VWLYNDCQLQLAPSNLYLQSTYNAIQGLQIEIDNIKALFLLNNSNKTITFGYGSSVALLIIVR
jgi:hypothetical protein